MCICVTRALPIKKIFTGCRAAAGGVTSLLCMPNTKPAVDTPETVRYILDKQDRRCARLRCGGDYKGTERRRAVRLRSAARCRRHCFERRRSPGHRYRLPCRGIMRSAEAPHARDGALRRLFLAKKWVMHEGEVSENSICPGVPAAAEDCGTAREIAARLRRVTFRAHLPCQHGNLCGAHPRCQSPRCKGDGGDRTALLF